MSEETTSADATGHSFAYSGVLKHAARGFIRDKMFVALLSVTRIIYSPIVLNNALFG